MSSGSFTKHDPKEKASSMPEDGTKLSKKGIILAPQPPVDARDPLKNWSMRRKAKIVAVLFLALFAGFSAPFCRQLNLQQQATLYHKTTVQITYFNSAASGGLATGGYLWWPLSHKFGRSAVIFWTLFGVLAAQIWAPMMTGPNDYAPYLVSRYFASFFGVVVSILGPRYLVDMFFLHQRGRAFTILHLALNFGASAGLTFAGFVAASSYWPVEYWWSVALVAFTIIVVFLYLEETYYDRTDESANRIPPSSWLRDRFETFPGTKVVPPVTWGEVARGFVTPFKIAIAPVLLVIAGFDTISFDFYVALNALTPVWLQTPIAHGGVYVFTVAQNAAFTLLHWVGFLWVPSRPACTDDDWHSTLTRSKDRSHLRSLFQRSNPNPTNFVLMPLGLGLVGACMQYKLHWFVMALAQLFVTIGSLVSIPITVNYICECFRTHTVEATLVLNSMRLFLRLSINFYIQPWISAVGIGWVYGSMASFTVFAFCFLIFLMVWGHKIRSWSPFHTSQSEEGEHILKPGSHVSVGDALNKKI
ncbi:MFS-type transporter [Seiridium cupressi]